MMMGSNQVLKMIYLWTVTNQILVHVSKISFTLMSYESYLSMQSFIERLRIFFLFTVLRLWENTE
jgi:hypothetical protein